MSELLTRLKQQTTFPTSIEGVYIRVMTVGERKALMSGKDGKAVIDEDWANRLLSFTLSDKEGKRIVEDEKEVNNLNSQLIPEFIEIALKVNGFGKQDKETIDEKKE